MAYRIGFLVGGILCLLILGLGGGIIAAAGLTAACSNDAATQALLNVPSCDSTLGVAAFGFVLLVIGVVVGVVLLVKAHKPDAPATVVMVPPPPPPPPQAAPGRVCLGCGRMLPEPTPAFCPGCGKAVPT